MEEKPNRENCLFCKFFNVKEKICKKKNKIITDCQNFTCEEWRGVL